MDAELLLHLPAGAGQPQFSPDSTQLAYLEDGTAWVRPLEGSAEPRPLGPGRLLRWPPDGAALTLLRVEDGTPSVWRQPLDPAEAPVRLSPAGMTVKGYAWSPDGRRLAVLEAAALDCDPATLRLTPAHTGKLWLVDTATGDARHRADVPPGEWPRRLTWSPDGRHLAWDVLLFDEDSEAAATEEVRLNSVAGGPVQRVVPFGACQTKAPSWRPDSQALAFIATPLPYGYQVLFGLATWNLRGGPVRYLTRDPMIVHGLVWAPDGQTIYAQARQASITEQLYAVSVQDGAVRQLTSGLAHHQAPVVPPDGRWLACEVEAPDRLTEVWLVATDGSGAQPVTAANRRLDVIAGLHRLESGPVRWHSADGLALEGFLLYPPDYGPDRPPSKPLPTIVDLHGGPIDVAPRRRLGDHPLRFSGLHYLAEHGYLCFAADYRKTGTYGWTHLQRMFDRGDFVGLDPTDILSGVDHLVVAGLADPAQLGLRGHSYGAYLVNWLVTQSGRFRAAVSVEGVTDWSVAARPDPRVKVSLDISKIDFGGALEEVPERYRRASPIVYAAQARTPLLLMEGAQSPCAQTRKGEAFRDALVAGGLEVEYVQYPGEGHAMLRPDHQADYLHRMLAWFDRYLRPSHPRPAEATL